MFYRVNRSVNAVAMVQHQDGLGWCGPVIPAESHHRYGEIRGPAICIACGTFCEDIDDVHLGIARRMEAAFEARARREDAAAERMEKLRRAGVDISKLAPPRARAPRPRPKTLDLFARSR